MGFVRHDGECVGVVFGLAWRLPNWEGDRPEGAKFGLPPRVPRGQLVERRQKPALGNPEQVLPGFPVLRHRLPPRLQFSSVSSKRCRRRLERSGRAIQIQLFKVGANDSAGVEDFMT